MKAEDDFELHWCAKHENWWVTNCPDCMVDANEEGIKKAGIREVVGWTARELGIDWGLEEEILKEWGVDE